MKRVRLRALITPDHVRYILYAPMAILLPVALTAIFMISLLSCVMPLVKILLTLRHVCVGHQEGSRAKLLTMCNVSSILTLHQEHGDRSSIGRALDCGSSGCGFKPHRSPSIFHFLSPGVTRSIVFSQRTDYASRFFSLLMPQPSSYMVLCQKA